MTALTVSLRHQELWDLVVQVQSSDWPLRWCLDSLRETNSGVLMSLMQLYQRSLMELQVMSLLEDAKAGRPLMGPGGGPAGTSATASGSLSPLSPTSASSLFGTASTPPLSPRSDRPMSPKSPLRRQGSSGLGSHLGSPVRGPGAQTGAAKSSFEAIPQVPHSLFLFPSRITKAVREDGP